MADNVNKEGKLDILFPYVDNNDPEWQKLYREEVLKTNINDEHWRKWVTGMQRFRPNGTLKYLFRSIDKYAPWVDKIHMVVQSESQIPDWLDRSKVNIIYHEDFIPKEFLPTFNSSAIEMFYHNIDCLPENFVYGNDDTIFTSKTSASDFFQNDKLVFGIKARKKKGYPGDYSAKNIVSLLSNYDGHVYSIQHTFKPHRKSIMKRVFEDNKDVILKNITKFRSKTEFTQSLFSVYAYLNKMNINRELPNFNSTIKTSNMPKILNTNWRQFKAVCFNDHVTTTDDQINKILKKFNDLFPNKCKYEKGYDPTVDDIATKKKVDFDPLRDNIKNMPKEVRNFYEV